jgi:hypothetical protein
VSVQPLFLLGAPKPHWLWGKGIEFPLFVSYRQLSKVVHLKPATCPWALDSSGFTILAKEGRWTISPARYVADVRRYQRQIGNLLWAAPQDWMCEPAVIHGGHFAGMTFVGTKLSVAEHQRRTVANYLELTDLWRQETRQSRSPFVPVLQGWELPDYLHCLELYRAAGVDLTAAPVVGLGSVCRRQSSAEIGLIVTVLANHGLRLHGFGVKTLGLDRYGHHLISADSQGWSRTARNRPPLPGCTGHKNCANCLIYATRWRTRLLERLAARTQHGRQGDIFDLLPLPDHAHGESAA